jgi:hypothetical protein
MSLASYLAQSSSLQCHPLFWMLLFWLVALRCRLSVGWKWATRAVGWTHVFGRALPSYIHVCGRPLFDVTISYILLSGRL